MDFAPLINARKALSDIWSACQLKGRCWGPKGSDNPFAASNITMAKGSEIVSICQLPDGRLRIHEFCLTIGGTDLGNQVRQKLEEEGLAIEKPGK